MRVPSALRSHYEDELVRDFEGKFFTRKHKSNTVYTIQLCKEIERLLDTNALSSGDSIILQRLLNFDPRAKVEIDV